jgi:hypothetical protein
VWVEGVAVSSVHSVTDDLPVILLSHFPPDESAGKKFPNINHGFDRKLYNVYVDISEWKTSKK